MQNNIINPEEIERFCEKLTLLEQRTVQKEQYTEQYLHHILQHKKYFVEIYATVLNHVLASSVKPREAISLVDYGTGNGLLGLFAKFCGFKQVTLIDISKEFIESANVLDSILKIGVDMFIIGSENSLLNDVKFKPDAIVGTDVIEHIYNLEVFFVTIKKLNPNIITVFTTASNYKNKVKSFQLKRLQKIDEWKGWSSNSSNGYYPSFREIRMKIIREAFPSFTDTDIKTLVSLTRGRNKEDIVSACQNFADNGHLPGEINHSTNTCDPYTGSWSERLLTFEEYGNLYRQNSLTLYIYKGYYNTDGSFIKNNVKTVANFLIKHMGKAGFSLCPFIILKGV